MISVIVCSRREPEWEYHERNVSKTIGLKHEYIRIDNTTGSYGICAAYNEGVSRANGELLVFVHEDVFFMEPGWGSVLEGKFCEHEHTGLVGVAGTQYLREDNPLWLAAGQPFLRGRVIHEIEGGAKFYLSVFSWDRGDAEVVAADGLFFAVPKKLFRNVRFDETVFDEFHFYDLDICMQIRRTHKLIVTWDILVKHLSAGDFSETWKEAGGRFLDKYKHELPVSCIGELPKATSNDIVCGRDYDLKGKVPQVTII